MNDRIAIENLLSSYVASWRRGDWEKWGALFTDISDFVTWGGVRWRTRDENVEQHRRAPPDVQKQLANYSLYLLDLEFLSESIALSHVRWEWSEFSQNGMPPSDRTGLITMVFVQCNDQWLIKASHNSRIFQVDDA